MAVVEYVDKKRTLPPPELELGWNMQSFGGLLESGSVLDQPVAATKRVRIALNVFKTWSTYRMLKGGSIATWIRANPDEWKMVRQIEEMIRNG